MPRKSPASMYRTALVFKAILYGGRYVRRSILPFVLGRAEPWGGPGRNRDLHRHHGPQRICRICSGNKFRTREGVKLNEPIPSKTILAWMIIFSLVTPVGVLIGTAVQEADESVATAVITAAAAGTFIYVALAEVAIPELEKPGNPLEKTACVVAGYLDEPAGYLGLILILISRGNLSDESTTSAQQ